MGLGLCAVCTQLFKSRHGGQMLLFSYRATSWVDQPPRTASRGDACEWCCFGRIAKSCKQLSS